MGDEARREYFKVRFVVDDIATAFTNKYEGTASDLLSLPREMRDRRYRASGRRST